ncbi:hypothetical protein AAKU67_002748 [Oxalobacteraceae bacterium GrIS 2.11]
MRQYRKGQRLVALCEQKIQTTRRIMGRLNLDRKKLLEQIQECETELRTLDDMLTALQFSQTVVTKAQILNNLRQKALLLHQRQTVTLDRTLHLENVTEIDNEIVLCQKQLAAIARKEMKFTKWMKQGKQQWMMQQESISEDEKQDIFPWVM